MLLKMAALVHDWFPGKNAIIGGEAWSHFIAACSAGVYIYDWGHTMAQVA